MTLSVVLSTFDTIKVATSYKINDVETEEFPYELPENMEVIYTELPGWNEDLTGMKSEDEFPEELNNYIAYLETELEIPITIVSVGPDRQQTILRGEN